MFEDRIYYKVLKKLVEERRIARKARILVVCGGKFDVDVLSKLGFENVLITDITKNKYISDYEFRVCDANNLPFKDNSFDYAFVHAGLHHSHSPHKALLEMYRVAKKGILVCEAQDNLFVRLLIKLKLTEDYEFSSVSSGTGGADNTGSPNYVYRWSKREVEKLVRSLNYKKEPDILYFSEFYFPNCFEKNGSYGPIKGFIAKKFATIANIIAPSCGNLLCFFIDKQRMKFHPWITYKV